MEAVDNIVHNIPESVAFDPALANEVGKIHEKPYFDVEKLQASLNGEEESAETSAAEAETEEAAGDEATEAEEGDTAEETAEETAEVTPEAPAETTVS